jgi:hypothetical protein
MAGTSPARTMERYPPSRNDAVAYLNGLLKNGEPLKP